MYINHDPVMTLTYFKAMSTNVANAFEWGKLLKCHLKGKCMKWAVGLNIHDSEKVVSRGSYVPTLGQYMYNAIIFKHLL